MPMGDIVNGRAFILFGVWVCFFITFIKDVVLEKQTHNNLTAP